MEYPVWCLPAQVWTDLHAPPVPCSVTSLPRMPQVPCRTAPHLRHSFKVWVLSLEEDWVTQESHSSLPASGFEACSTVSDIKSKLCLPAWDFVVGVVRSLIPGEDTAPLSCLTRGNGSSSASYMCRELAGKLSFRLTHKSIHLLSAFFFFFLIFLIWEANPPLQCISPVPRPMYIVLHLFSALYITKSISIQVSRGYLFLIFL